MPLRFWAGLCALQGTRKCNEKPNIGVQVFRISNFEFRISMFPFAMNKRSRLLLRLLPFLLLIACGKGGAPGTSQSAPKVQDQSVKIEATGETDPSAAPEAVPGGTFASWQGDYPKSLNMWLDNNSFSGVVSSMMFEPLVELHSTEDRPIGELAESWEISPDKKSYTFHLNPAAKWSDGKPVTAADVQFFYDVMMNPKNLTSLFRVDLSKISRPEVLDDYTLRITAKEPHWKLFWIAGGLVAFPRQVWANVDFNTVNFEFPVVDGPYALDEVKTNRSIRLKRRGDWWGRVKKYNEHKFNFDYLVFKSMEDRTKALEFLKTGGFDQYAVYTAKIWAQDTPVIPQVQKNWVVRQNVYNRFPVGFQGFALNMRRPLFQDLRVRQALAYLLNRQLMNQKLMFNEYFLLNSYFPDLYPGDVNPAIPATQYDPNLARALLAQSGWQVGADGVLAKNGQPLGITILHYEGSDMRHLTIYLEALKSVGINAQVELVSQATWTKRIDNHEFDIVWAAWAEAAFGTLKRCGVRRPPMISPARIGPVSRTPTWTSSSMRRKRRWTLGSAMISAARSINGSWRKAPMSSCGNPPATGCSTGTGSERRSLCSLNLAIKAMRSFIGGMTRPGRRRSTRR